MGFVCGLVGFGWRAETHEARCQKRHERAATTEQIEKPAILAEGEAILADVEREAEASGRRSGAPA